MVSVHGVLNEEKTIINLKFNI